MSQAQELVQSQKGHSLQPKHDDLGSEGGGGGEKEGRRVEEERRRGGGRREEAGRGGRRRGVGIRLQYDWLSSFPTWIILTRESGLSSKNF